MTDSAPTGGPTPDAVQAALAGVPYPGFSRDIVSFGLLRDVRVDGGNVEVQLVLTTADDAVRRQVSAAVEAAVRALPGVTGVVVAIAKPAPVRLPAAGSPAAAPEAPRGPLARHIVGVASGKGGVGKSTVAVNLAVTLAQQGLRVGYLDADVHGPSAPLMFGLEGRRPDQADEAGRPLPLEAFGVKVMSMGFFVDRDSAVIWRGPIVGNFIKQLLSDVAWGELDYLVIDFPPGTGDAQLTISQTLKLSGVIIVSTPNELALVDAVKAIGMFRRVEVPILGLVENMSYFCCPSCGTNTEIFGHGGPERAALKHAVPLVGRVPIDPDVVAESDRGVPVVVERPESAAAQAYRAIARAVTQAVVAQSAESAPGLGAFLDRFGQP